MAFTQFMRESSNRKPQESNMSHSQLTYRCPACQRVKEQHWDGSAGQDWCTMAEYVQRCFMQEHDVILSEFYCTDCTVSYDRLVQYGRTNPSCFT